MTSFLGVLLAALVVSGFEPQTQNDTAVASAFYAVSYVEVGSSSRTAAVAALKRYREGMRVQDGYVRFELFEQVGRPGHFAVVETWRDLSAFDRRAVEPKQIQDALQPLRVSGYDQRPYKTLTVGATSGALTGRAIVVVSHVDVSPDPRVPALLKRLADESRQDKGNLRFDVL